VVREGAALPDITSEASLKAAVLAARSLSFSTGPSGVYLAKLFERWGIADQVASRMVQAPPGVPVGSLVARGEAELGFQQLSELMHLKGITVLGAMPPAVQFITTFSGALCAASTQGPVVRDLLAWMASPATAEAKRRHGMDPA
jgi:molybdate transport system substrate-binding protein